MNHGYLYKLPSRSILCKWMPENVRQKATPPNYSDESSDSNDLFAEVVNTSFDDGEAIDKSDL